MNNSAVLSETVPGNAVLAELFTYAFFSLVLIFLMDRYAAKKIGGRDKAGYKVLNMPRHISLYLIYGFTLAVTLLCMYTDFSVSRGTLSFFGIPYFIGLFYYLMKMLQRVKAESCQAKQPVKSVSAPPKKKKKKK